MRFKVKYNVTLKMTSVDGALFKIISYGETQCEAQATLNKNLVTSYGKKTIETDRWKFMYTHAYIYIQIYIKIYVYIYVFMCQSN